MMQSVMLKSVICKVKIDFISAFFCQCVADWLTTLIRRCKCFPKRICVNKKNVCNL